MIRCVENIEFEQLDSGYLGFFLQHKENIACFDAKYNRTIHYELNPKLFAINEPFLMKTERDSLIKFKIRSEEISDSDLSIIKPNSSSRKRKNLEKKLTLLDDNLDTPEEKSMACRLIGKYLNKNLSFENGSKINKKHLLKSLKTGEKDPNSEAQSFVNSLFCNRFESLNYRTKLLCNPFYKPHKVKFGLSNFLIPPRCSFAGIDVIEGVRKLTRYLKLALIESKDRPLSYQSLICHKNPFLLIMDPAWDNNKSVKRKRAYETVSLDYMRRLCRETKCLIDLVSTIKSSKTSKNSNKDSPPIICAIWTTHLDKEFVIEEMLPLLNLKLSHRLKWHKVTKSGLPVKVHGGQEYLILAIKCSDQVRTQDGIIVSVPSAIHSHKPSVIPVIKKLFNFNVQDHRYDISPFHCSTHDPNHPSFSSDSVQEIKQDQSNEYWLASNEFINSVCGLELFARYLQTGFHSIGYECIKLQNEKLFSIVG